MATRQKKKTDFSDYERPVFLSRQEFDQSDWSEFYDFEEFCERSLERALDGKPDARLSYF